MSLEKLMNSMKHEMEMGMLETDKFSGGNKSAGTRVRKHMQNIKNIAQNVRQEVQHQKMFNSIPS